MCHQKIVKISLGLNVKISNYIKVYFEVYLELP